MDPGAVPLPGDSLGAVLAEQARRHSVARTVFPGTGEILTLSELDEAATRHARGLLGLGLGRDEIVGLLLPVSAHLLVSLFAVARAGAAATVLPAPAVQASSAVQAGRLGRIIRAAGIRVLIADPANESVLRELARTVADLLIIPATPAGPPAARACGPLPRVDPDALAVVQFTSGSTAAPRGVALHHRTVLAGLRAIVLSGRTDARDVFVQWVPPYHDMGLFGLLSNVLNGETVHVFEPFAFLRRPAAFLRYLAEQRATLVTGSNFGYDLMLDAAEPELVAALDLSRWRLAYNGAEPVSATTVRRFHEVLGPAGIAPSVMYPAYGMAEVTLAITFPEPGSRPRIVHVDRDTLAGAGPVATVPAGHPRARPLVSVGRPVAGLELRIAEESDRPSAPGAVGEIQVRGEAVMAGYHRDEAATRSVFAGSWLRTGDLGFQLDGELFVAGRRKEMAIVHGRNFFPEDIESIVREVPGVYRRRCVAVPMRDPAGGEHIVVIMESRLPAEAGPALAEAARHRIAVQLDLHAVRVHVVRPRWLTRTTSGKWQRLSALARLADQRECTVSVPS